MTVRIVADECPTTRKQIVDGINYFAFFAVKKEDEILFSRVNLFGIRFPQESPQNLFICTKWTEISYSGAFFRASGGNAAAFIEKSGVLSKQGDSIKAHSHTFSGTTGGMSKNANGSVSCGSEGLFNGRGTISTSGCISVSGSTFWAGGDNKEGGRPTTMSIDVSHTHSYSGTTSNTGSNETRPENYSIRVWKRTA